MRACRITPRQDVLGKRQLIIGEAEFKGCRIVGPAVAAEGCPSDDNLFAGEDGVAR